MHDFIREGSPGLYIWRKIDKSDTKISAWTEIDGLGSVFQSYSNNIQALHISAANSSGE